MQTLILHKYTLYTIRILILVVVQLLSINSSTSLYVSMLIHKCVNKLFDTISALCIIKTCIAKQHTPVTHTTYYKHKPAPTEESM